MVRRVLLVAVLVALALPLPGRASLTVLPSLRLVLGAWGFWRRDLTREDVASFVPEQPETTYRLGGTSYGVVGRVGFEI